MFVACVCLAFTSMWVYCMLGYSGKWHHQSLWCTQCTFTMQWQQYLLPVSCFHFSVSLLYAWLFWKMTSLLCWKFTLVYRVHIGYAMATIPFACIMQSLQNSNKQLYQFHQSWFTSIANCVWVELGIARFGINTPSLSRIIKGVWCSLELLARYTHILCTLMVHLIGYSAMTSIPYHFLEVSQQYGRQAM